ncbi:MAG: DUF6514 family protein [Defluviitaleaceae bacterium]|nr:DUF6514 family protein [Defluviitaleaceae bacterium]
MKSMICETEERDFTLKYFKGKVEGEDGETFYEIIVEKFIGGVLKDVIGTGPITESESQVESVIEILARNTVTPLTLLEIVDDMLNSTPAHS